MFVIISNMQNEIVNELSLIRNDIIFAINTERNKLKYDYTANCKQ